MLKAKVVSIKAKLFAIFIIFDLNEVYFYGHYNY
jgi:hypothetical protein